MQASFLIVRSRVHGSRSEQQHLGQPSMAGLGLQFAQANIVYRATHLQVLGTPPHLFQRSISVGMTSSMVGV
jgi:hypothetical protein